MNNWEKRQAESRARRQAIEDAKKALEPSRFEKAVEKILEPVATVIGAILAVVALVAVLLFFGLGPNGMI